MGSCFNPIIAVDREEAASVVELFRVDVLWPVTKRIEVAAFVAQFPHLISPFSPDGLFIAGGQRSHCQMGQDI